MNKFILRRHQNRALKGADTIGAAQDYPEQIPRPLGRGCVEGFIISAINLYRNYLSSNKLRCCRFYPSCSEYAIDAVEKYGAIFGLLKAGKRILRCHPFSPGGYDPA